MGGALKKVGIIVILALIFPAGPLWGQEDFEYVNSALFHDYYQTTAEIGNYVYCQGENGLQIIDVQNLADPVFVKNLEDPDLGILAKSAQPIDSFLCTFYGRHFNVFDISDTLHPEFIGSYETDFGNIRSAYINGNIAFLVIDSSYGNSSNFLRVIDLSDPASPSLLSTSWFYHELILFASGNLLYIVHTPDFDLFPNGLYIYDVSDPEHPILVSDTNFEYFLPHDFAIHDGIMIVVGPYGILIVDVSDPEDPEIITTMDEYYDLSSITANGDYAYMSTWTSDLPGNYIYSFYISDPITPEYLGQFETILPITDIFVDNNYIYYAGSNGHHNYTSALNIVDFADPYNPSLTGRYAVPGAVNDVQVYQNYAFVANDYSGLQVIDIGDPFNPVLVESIITPDKAEDIFIAGDYAYLTNYADGLLIFDISEPQEPVQAGSFLTDDYLFGVSVDEGRAYLICSDYYDYYLAILDVSDPYNPYLINTYDDLYLPRFIKVIAGIAYILDDYTLEIVDMADPMNPIQISSHTFEYRGFNLYVDNNLVYVTCGDGGLQILNVSDLHNPVFVGEYVTENACAVTIDGTYAYMSFFDERLELVDISDPSEPVFVAGYSGAESRNEVSVRGEYIYVATEKYLLILCLTETGLEEVGTIYPNTFSLSRNYPNPFNASTTISYDLPTQSEVKIEIYDLLGRKIETLLAGTQPAGSHSVVWNAEDASSGVYFYRIEAGDFVETRKCVLLK